LASSNIVFQMRNIIKDNLYSTELMEQVKEQFPNLPSDYRRIIAIDRALSKSVVDINELKLKKEIIRNIEKEINTSGDNVG
jgi:hypothetical protein